MGDIINLLDNSTAYIDNAYNIAQRKTQHLAQKHFDFFTVKYDYDVFPYPATAEGLSERLFTAVLEEEKKTSENTISLKTYSALKDKGVLNREHLFHHDEDKEHIFSNYDKGVSYHKIIEIPGLVMNDIIPLDKEDLWNEFYNRKNYTRQIFTEAYTNEYLYLLLYHALWDTLSRETPKNIKSIRWYELLKKQNATDRWQGIFAPFEYERLDHLLNMIAKGYGFKMEIFFMNNL